MSKNNISSVDKDCTGCGACYNSCPVTAIEMESRKGGFLTPVILDGCISCGKCITACPAVNDVKRAIETQIESYAMVNSDLEELSKSSSGGVFLKVAKHVIENLQGVVFGAVYADAFKVNIAKAESVDQLMDMAGSKYVYSNTGNSYKEVEKELKAGRTVLYSGVSCQIAGLYGYLQKEYPDLVTIEVLCHGAPSQGLFDKYIQHMESRYKDKINFLNQRDKSKPWNPLITKRIRIGFESGKHKIWAEDYDPYMSLYVRELAYRDSCYKCKYVGTERIGDIVLGDFGGLGMIEKCSLNLKQGVSLGLVNTEKGRAFLDRVDGIHMEKRKLNEVTMLNSCLRDNVKIPAGRDAFVQDFERLTGDELFDKYFYKNYPYRMRAFVKRLLFTVVGPDNVAKILYRSKK